MKIAVQGIVAILFLLIFTFCAWYEGSKILDNSPEWKYSTPFSGKVTDSKDISNLDYFVYAAKFRPMFPALMLLMVLYLFTLSGFKVFRGRYKKLAYFLAAVGLLLLLFSSLVWGSPTVGGRFLKGSCLIFGVVYILVAALSYFKIPIRLKA